MPSFPKPPPRKGNKNGEEAYKKWLREVLFPAWWQTASTRALYPITDNGVEYLPLPCARCKSPGYIARHKDGTYGTVGVCVGHLTGRGREPKFKMDVNNVEAQCMACNGSLDRGMKKIDTCVDKPDMVALSSDGTDKGG